jgi:hypothetical protein
MALYHREVQMFWEFSYPVLTKQTRQKKIMDLNSEKKKKKRKERKKEKTLGNHCLAGFLDRCLILQVFWVYIHFLWLL